MWIKMYYRYTNTGHMVPKKCPCLNPSAYVPSHGFVGVIKVKDLEMDCTGGPAIITKVLI